MNDTATPDREEINRFLWEKVEGNCFHKVRYRTDEEREWVPGFLGFGGRWKRSAVLPVCQKCGHDVDAYIYNGKLMTTGTPDYTNSLNAVHRLELAAIERFGAIKVGQTLWHELCKRGGSVTNFDEWDKCDEDRRDDTAVLMILAATADALTRCRALVSLYMEER